MKINILHWLNNPKIPPSVNKQNFINVQNDAIGVGIANAASPFLPVFLTRLGATSFEVGLLTSMPAVTGFFFSILLGRFLQKQSKIVPWFSGSRLIYLTSYVFTGLIPFFIKDQSLVTPILIVWALATIPQVILQITFSVVMNSVAGPTSRFELLSRRWSILGVTTAGMVLVCSQILDNVLFPYNYQIVFIVFSVGGLLSYYFSRKIDLPPTPVPEILIQPGFRESMKSYFNLIAGEKPFVSFAFKRFVYLFGISMATPLFPLYFVRQIHATDGWIAAINTAQLTIMIFGYFFWSQQSRKRGSRSVILWTTLGVGIYPILTALTNNVWLIAIYAGVVGIFQAGLDLVFFDELMKTFPPEYSATFVSTAQSLQHLSTIIAPFISTFLADQIGLSAALICSGVIRLIGFLLFYLGKPAAQQVFES